MNRLFPTMIERPDSKDIVGVLLFPFFGFLLIPLVFNYLLGDSWENMTWRGWFEFGCHVFNFLVIGLAFREFLAESFWNVRLNVKRFLGMTVAGVLLVFGMAALIFLAGMLADNEFTFMMARYMLPIFENESVMMARDFVAYNPVPGMICLVLIAPVTTACIYYAAGFAPTCENHPLLAYLAVAGFLAVPRLLHLVALQPLTQELPVYLAQLPIHWAICWIYQKTDTVWAPIAVLSITNLLVCGAIFLLPF